MTIQLDHFTVPARNKFASAKLLAELLGVTWAEANVGPFCSVFVNDGLTIDFDETPPPFPVHHCAFRVEQVTFDAILARIRAAGILYRSTPNGLVDMQVNTNHGGSIVYWDAPDGHYWELLTVSYARRSD